MLFSWNSNRKSIALENLHEHLGRYMTGEFLAQEMAYAEVAWFRAALDHRANAFSNVPFDLLDRSGNVIANESDYEEALGDDAYLNIFPVLPALVTDLDMYGAAYATFEANDFGLNGAWRRLHPASIRPWHDTVTGELLYFNRTIGGRQQRIELDDENFFWLWMPERSRENYPGEGVGRSAIRAATTINNTDIFQSAFFKNGALNPTILQIKDWATTDSAEKERVGNVLSRLMSGVRNAFKIVPLDGDVKVMSLMQNLKDMAMMELTMQQRENISTATGVPHSMLFSNAANYATAQQDDFNFYDKTIVPFAVRIPEMQLNERFFRRLGYRLKYRKERLEVYQRLEVEKVDKLVQLFDRAIVDENEVRTQINLEPREDFDVPERLLAQTQGQNAQTQEADSQAKSLKSGEALQAFAYLPLANNADIVRIIQSLKGRYQFDDERIQWQAAPTYHVTLCFAQLISDDVIDQMASLLKPFEVELHGAYLDVFETPEGKALHIRLENSQALMDLQSHVHSTFFNLPNGGLSEYSIPANWKPHITLAMLPNEMEWEIEPVNFRALVDCVIVGRDDYEPALIVEAPKRIKALKVDDMKTDFQKWERLTLKRWEEGKREKALAFNSEYIPATQAAAVVGALEVAQNIADVKAIFAEAVFTAPLWGQYA